jgi:hypothetical protein
MDILYALICAYVCQPEVEATTTHTATAAVAGPVVDSPAVAAAAVEAEMGEAVAVAAAGSTRVGEAGAARAPTASKCKQQSACRELFFLCKITRKNF